MSQDRSDEDGNTDSGFELEPADRRPIPQPETPGDTELPRGERDEADGRTVAERQGTAVEPTQGALPPPPGWPHEVLQFPLRPPGRMILLSMSAAFVIADVLVGINSIAFLGMIGVMLLWIFCFRLQAAIAGQSAAGKDAPTGWEQSLELDYEILRTFAKFWITFALLTAALYIAVSYELLSSGAASATAILGSLFLSVSMLGCALGDRALARPWNALPWLARRPLAFAAGAAGWWVMGAADVAIRSSASGSLAIVASLILRPLGVYAMLVSARVLGVVGRSWTPWGYQTPGSE